MRITHRKRKSVAGLSDAPHPWHSSVYGTPQEISQAASQSPLPALQVGMNTKTCTLDGRWGAQAKQPRSSTANAVGTAAVNHSPRVRRVYPHAKVGPAGTSTNEEPNDLCPSTPAVSCRTTPDALPAKPKREKAVHTLLLISQNCGKRDYPSHTSALHLGRGAKAQKIIVHVPRNPAEQNARAAPPKKAEKLLMRNAP